MPQDVPTYSAYSPWLTLNMSMNGMGLQGTQWNNRWKTGRNEQTFQKLSRVGDTKFEVQVKSTKSKYQVPETKAIYTLEWKVKPKDTHPNTT